MPNLYSRQNICSCSAVQESPIWTSRLFWLWMCCRFSHMHCVLASRTTCIMPHIWNTLLLCTWLYSINLACVFIPALLFDFGNLKNFFHCLYRHQILYTVIKSNSLSLCSALSFVPCRISSNGFIVIKIEIISSSVYYLFLLKSDYMTYSNLFGRSLMILACNPLIFCNFCLFGTFY